MLERHWCYLLFYLISLTAFLFLTSFIFYSPSFFQLNGPCWWGTSCLCQQLLLIDEIFSTFRRRWTLCYNGLTKPVNYVSRHIICFRFPKRVKEPFFPHQVASSHVLFPSAPSPTRKKRKNKQNERGTLLSLHSSWFQSSISTSKCIRLHVFSIPV